MAKQFYTTGEGAQQVLTPADQSKIKVYDDKAAAQADISNIEENEIIATKAGESEGVVEVVDTVEENNPNAVSSGAVYDYVNTKLPDYNNITTVVTATTSTSSSTSVNYTVEKSGWHLLQLTGYSGSSTIGTARLTFVNNDTYVITSVSSNGNGVGNMVYLYEGMRVTMYASSTAQAVSCRLFRLGD